MNTQTIGRRLAFASLVFSILFTFAPKLSAAPDDDGWSLRVGVNYVSPEGHDPKVLLVDDGNSRSYAMQTQSGIGYQLGVRLERGTKWDWGADFRTFTGPQELNVPMATASAGGPPVTFRITERSFASTSPTEVLFFDRLGDTDMNAWTADLYALRELSNSTNGTTRVLLGLRNADFDNDTHLMAGVEGIRGTRLDASSNYSRMIGPLVGLVVDRRRGKSEFEFTVALSVVQGDVELEASLFDFGTILPAATEGVPQQIFNRSKSVTIPITDLAGRWAYSVGERISLGMGLALSHWSDVSVPPGVRPTGSLSSEYETSITFPTLSALVEIDF